MSKPPTPTGIRLDRKTQELPNGCVVFTGFVMKHGYATIWHNGAKKLVHRVAYELVHGPIPDGLQIDHLCKNRRCVNVQHLEAVTPHENNRRSESKSALEARQTHCIHNHPFDEANTRIIKGHRHCRRCDADRQNAYRARKAAV